MAGGLLCSADTCSSVCSTISKRTGIAGLMRTDNDRPPMVSKSTKSAPALHGVEDAFLQLGQIDVFRQNECLAIDSGMNNLHGSSSSGSQRFDSQPV
jgi:hypothetical protein